ncbi:hypothetical protein FKW77_009407 [Venturia effusa]|uniref:Uncharacterized protein n=1 Tax=Venturia effusa TaxID=50376 RepID=A0A517L844_9PEZI|nr:hypothetical protein FKW77_009407 [Venturia effusa]
MTRTRVMRGTAGLINTDSYETQGHTETMKMSDPNEDTNQIQSPFLRIPRELRDKIYRNILKETGSNLIESNYDDDEYPFSRYHGCNNVVDTQILATNNQIFHEAGNILYKENTFVVILATHHDCSPTTWSRIEVLQRARAANLKVRMSCHQFFRNGVYIFASRVKLLVQLEEPKSLEVIVELPVAHLVDHDLSCVRFDTLKPLKSLKVSKKISLRATLCDPDDYEFYEEKVAELEKFEEDWRKRCNLA